MAMTKTVVDVRDGTSVVRDLTQDELDAYDDLTIAMAAESVNNAARHADLDNQSLMFRALVLATASALSVDSSTFKSSIETEYAGLL